MKKLLAPAAVIAVFAATPLHAQSAKEAASDAAEAAMDAAEAAVDEAGSPPPVLMRPSESATEFANGFDRAAPPNLIGYSALDARPTDYPPASWAADEQGMVEFELSVTETGLVSACQILESSGFAALDAKTCEIAIERGKFEPALSDAGEPVAGTHRDRMVWDKREPEFPGSSTVRVAYTVGKDGMSRDCEVIEVSGEISEGMRRSMDREPCPGINRPARALYRDENGNPVSKRLELMIVVKTETLEE